MAKKDKSAFSDLELDAFNSWKEWPILLAKELKRLQGIQNRLDGISPAEAAAAPPPALEAPAESAASTQTQQPEAPAASQPAAPAAPVTAPAPATSTPDDYMDFDYDDDIWFEDTVIPPSQNTSSSATSLPPSLAPAAPEAPASQPPASESSTASDSEETEDDEDFEYFDYEY